MESEAGKEVKKKELLVALLPRTSALDTLKNEGWYHMLVESMPGRWRQGWRPKAMAFYQGRVFGQEEAYKIRYFGGVDHIDIVPRKELLDAYLFDDLQEVRRIAENWLETYNTIRPHEALQGLPPRQFALQPA